MSCESYEHLYDKNWTYIFQMEIVTMLSQKKK